MPVSNEKFADLLYRHLPQIYRTEDSKVQPIPYPLKRFLQVASVGFEQVEDNIDNLALLFDPELMPEKFLDPVARMMGFPFPPGTTVEEKRRLLSNLPALYSLKGEDVVFGMLARLLFHKTAKATTEWVYKETSTSVKIKLDVLEGQPGELDLKRERYLKLIDFFRPVNVGISWTILVFYQYLIDLKVSDSHSFDILKVNDNYNTYRKYATAELNNQGFLLGDNFYTFGGLLYPETFNLLKSTDEHSDLMKVKSNYLVELKPEEKTKDNLLMRDKEETDVYGLDIGGRDVLVDRTMMLNYGLLGSTMILNQLPKITYL